MEEQEDFEVSDNAMAEETELRKRWGSKTVVCRYPFKLKGSKKTRYRVVKMKGKMCRFTGGKRMVQTACKNVCKWKKKMPSFHKKCKPIIKKIC